MVRVFYSTVFCLNSSTTMTPKMTVSAPVVSTLMKHSVEEKCRLLTYSSIGLKKTVHLPSVVGKSSQLVKEQLSQMLSNKFLQLPKSNIAGGAAATTMVKLSLPDTVDKPCFVLEKLKENTAKNQTSSHSSANNYVQSSDCHSVKQKAAYGSILLGKRTLNAEQGVNICPLKRPLIALLDSEKKSSQNDARCSSATSLMPILANALLTNNLSKAASISSSIPRVVLMGKCTTSCQTMSSSQSQDVDVGNLMYSDAPNDSTRNKTNVNVSTLPGNVDSQCRELLQTHDECSSSNNTKKDMSDCHGVSFKHSRHFDKGTNVIYFHKNANQPIFLNRLSSSDFIPGSAVASIPLLNSIVVSSAPLLCSPASDSTSLGGFVLATTIGLERSIQSGSCDVFVSSNRETITRDSNNVNPVVIASQEPMLTAQQVNPTANIKPLAPPVALPNLNPVIVVLGNPVLPSVAFPNSQVPHTTVNTPKLTVNGQLTELFVVNHNESINQGVIARVQQPVNSSEPLLAAGKPVRNPDYKSLTSSDASPRFIGVNQTASAISSFGYATTSFATHATSVCSISSNSRPVLNQTLQKYACINMTSMTEPVQLNWQNPIGIEATTNRPLLIVNQQNARLTSTSVLPSQTSLASSYGDWTQDVLASQLKNHTSICPPMLVACHPSAPTDQHSQMWGSTSKEITQVYCAAKNSLRALPVHQSKVLKSLAVSDLAVKFAADPIVAVRPVEPASVGKSYPPRIPAVTYCSILPSGNENAFASTPVPLFLIQSPLRAGPSTSETTLSLSSQLSVSSMSTSNCVSSLDKTPSQTPLVFQVVSDGFQSIKPQNIFINMMPLNGTVATKMKLGDGENYNQVKLAASFPALCSVTSCSSTNEAKSIGFNAYTINGTRMKMTTIKRYISVPEVSSCHLTSSGQQIPVQSGSLIKTLLSVQDPIVPSVGNSDGLASEFHINKNASYADSPLASDLLMYVEASRESDARNICSMCGSSLGPKEMGQGAGSTNSSGICVACRTRI